MVDPHGHNSGGADEHTPLLSQANGTVLPASDPAVAVAVAPASTQLGSQIDDHGADKNLPLPNQLGIAKGSKDDPDKPLPLFQLFILCIARVVEPVSFFSIFAYISQMITNLGHLPPSAVGFYSGLIESIFSLTQMMVMIWWGRASDKFGRKPCLVISLFGISVATALFGFAQNIWQMILFRCFAGVFAGTIVTIRTMVGEHSTPKTAARAFSWFAFTGNLGIFLGPFLGGALAEPARQFPGVFGGVRFFEKFPYALPTVVTGGFAAIAAIVCVLFLEETLVKEPETTAEPESGGNVVADSASNSSSSSTLYNAAANPQRDMSTWKLLTLPTTLPVLLLNGYVMILAFSFTAIFPVFMYTPIELGGFGFAQPYKISLLLGLSGLAQAIWLLLVFPPLQRRVGTVGVLRLCAYAYPVFFLIGPLINILLLRPTQSGHIDHHAGTVLFWIITPTLICLGVGVSMAFTACQLAVNAVSPSPQTLGRLNALALTGISGLRAFCPTAFASLYAAGVTRQILWGQLAWAVMIVLTFGYIAGVRFLPKAADGLVQDHEQESDTP